jgi:hypothetical protein
MMFAARWCRVSFFDLHCLTPLTRQFRSFSLLLGFGGRIQQCNWHVVNSAAQHEAYGFCCGFCREHGHLCGGDTRCVLVAAVCMRGDRVCNACESCCVFSAGLPATSHPLTQPNLGLHSDAVDLYNSATGSWSTARLSVARSDLAATSVGNLAIFAGGQNRDAEFRQQLLDVVDVFNSATGVWATARLSMPRIYLSATSAGNTAIFAAGLAVYGTANMGIEADLYNSANGTWSTARLSSGRWAGAATFVGTVALFAGGIQPEDWRGPSNATDLYNSATGTWSTAQLSSGRKHLAATSVGNVAIFAGGFTGAFSSLTLTSSGCVMVAFVMLAECRRSVACFLCNLRLSYASMQS